MKTHLLIALFTTVGAGTALAHHESGGQRLIYAQAPAAAQRTGKGTGLIQQVDREKGTVTIKHGPLPALNMGAMTMTYTIKDSRQLANLKPLQKVEFDLAYDGSDYLITEIR